MPGDVKCDQGGNKVVRDSCAASACTETPAPRGSLGHSDTKPWGTSTVLGLELGAGTNPPLHNPLAEEG